MASPTYAGNKPIGRGAQKNDDRIALGKLRSLMPVTAATVSADETAIVRSALVEDGSKNEQSASEKLIVKRSRCEGFQLEEP
jgi:hypothetical protein